MVSLSQKLIGFEKIFTTLKENLINKNLSNSLIFYGNKGIGKSTLTYFLINYVFDEIYKNNPSSNHTNLIYNNSHPSVRLLRKEYDEKTKKFKKNIIINQIRDLESFIYQFTIDGSPKFIIIDSSDDLNVNSSNALLKILEEPKRNTYIILITHQLSKLLPTIRSRCIKFKFSNPTFDQFNEIIFNQDESIDKNILKFLYDLSEGSPGLAIQLYSENFREIFDHLVEIFREKKPLSSNILQLSNKVGMYSNDQFILFLSLIKFIIVHTTKINLGIDIQKNFISDISESLLEISKYLDNQISQKILVYLNTYENDLFVYNLDKKIFILNIFSPLSNRI
jgi:DNA polymerase III delta prime subunit